MTAQGEHDNELFPIAAPTLERLHARLGAAASADGSLDVAYRHLDSPVGELLVAATKAGLVRVAFAQEGFHAVLADLAARISPRILSARGQLEEVAKELGEYFAGERQAFDLPLDRRLSTGFRGQVHRALPDIGYGRTTTYAQLATLVGNPRAVRAVGTACATNPLPIVVPCHRVLRADGSLGGYLGGTDAKAALLALEHAA